MKLLLILSFVLMANQSYAHINSQPFIDNKVSTASPNYNSTELKSEPSLLADEADTTVSPAIAQYVALINSHLTHDVDLLNSYCGNNIKTVEQRIAFKGCFDLIKDKLLSNMFKSSTELSLVFINSKTNKKQVAKQFLDTYQNHLNQILNITTELQFPSEPFYNSLTQLFSNMIKSSYKNSALIIGNDPKKLKEAEIFFIDLANNIDEIRANQAP